MFANETNEAKGIELSTAEAVASYVGTKERQRVTDDNSGIDATRFSREPRVGFSGGSPPTHYVVLEVCMHACHGLIVDDRYCAKISGTIGGCIISNVFDFFFITIFPVRCNRKVTANSGRRISGAVLCQTLKVQTVNRKQDWAFS